MILTRLRDLFEIWIKFLFKIIFSENILIFILIFNTKIFRLFRLIDEFYILNRLSKFRLLEVNRNRNNSIVFQKILIKKKCLQRRKLGWNIPTNCHQLVAIHNINCNQLVAIKKKKFLFFYNFCCCCYILFLCCF